MDLTKVNQKIEIFRGIAEIGVQTERLTINPDQVATIHPTQKGFLDHPESAQTVIVTTDNETHFVTDSLVDVRHRMTMTEEDPPEFQ